MSSNQANRSARGKVKAELDIADTIGILGIILIVMLLVTQLMPIVGGIIIESFSRASAENVAKQLSSLITVSGAAPYKAELNYTPTKDIVYKISISSRTIKVTPKFQVSYADKSSSTQPFGISLNDKQLVEVNSFFIKKNFVDGESIYAFDAEKV